MGNLRLAALLHAVAGLRFGLAVWVLYYLRVTDYAGIGLVEMVTILTAVVAEIPTGIVADSWGRRRTLITAMAVQCAGYLVLAGAVDVAGLCASLFLLGIGRSLYSGCFEALVFESLAGQGRSLEYTRILGRLQGIRLGGLATAAIVGGWLYSLDPSLPYLLAAATHGVAALLALGLQEPSREEFRIAVRGMAGAVALLCRRWRLALPMLVIGPFLVVIDEVLDDILAVELGFEPHQLGVLFALIYLVAAFAATQSDTLVRHFGGGRVLLALGLLSGLSLLPSPFIGMALGGSLVVLRYSLRAIYDTVASSRLNRIAGSAHRATVLSAYTTLASLPYVLLAWSLGALMDLWTARTFALGLGGVLLLASASLVVFRFARGNESVS